MFLIYFCYHCCRWYYNGKCSGCQYAKRF